MQRTAHKQGRHKGVRKRMASVATRLGGLEEGHPPAAARKRVPHALHQRRESPGTKPGRGAAGGPTSAECALAAPFQTRAQHPPTRRSAHALPPHGLITDGKALRDMGNSGRECGRAGDTVAEGPTKMRGPVGGDARLLGNALSEGQRTGTSPRHVACLGPAGRPARPARPLHPLFHLPKSCLHRGAVAQALPAPRPAATLQGE